MSGYYKEGKVSLMESMVAEYKKAAPNQQRHYVGKKNYKEVHALMRAEIARRKEQERKQKREEMLARWFLIPLFKRIVGRG
jgi:hypothetical protein